MLWRSVDIDESHFYHSTLNVFMLYVLNLQENPEFLGETIMFRMDYASLQVSEPVRRFIGQKKIMIILFLVCTVNIFQAFDLAFFVDIKRMKQTAAGEFGQAFSDERITILLEPGEQRVI
jgi:hypothetical protein